MHQAKARALGVLATALDTMTLPVRALRERMYRTHPKLRIKTISESRLCAVLVHELNIKIKKLTKISRGALRAFAEIGRRLLT